MASVMVNACSRNKEIDMPSESPFFFQPQTLNLFHLLLSWSEKPLGSLFS